MQTPTMSEMNEQIRDAAAAQAERALAVGQQWADWQIGQMKALESGISAAMRGSFSAFEQSARAALEMNRVLFGAFAPTKREDAARA